MQVVDIFSNDGMAISKDTWMVQSNKVYSMYSDRRNNKEGLICFAGYTYNKKEPGQFRPIQVQNLSLRLLEKSLSRIIKAWAYNNEDDFFGFVQNISTNDACSKVEIILESEPGTTVTFLDFSKAYNRANRSKLSKIITEKSEGTIRKGIITMPRQSDGEDFLISTFTQMIVSHRETPSLYSYLTT